MPRFKNKRTALLLGIGLIGVAIGATTSRVDANGGSGNGGCEKAVQTEQGVEYRPCTWSTTSTSASATTSTTPAPPTTLVSVTTTAPSPVTSTTAPLVGTLDREDDSAVAAKQVVIIPPATTGAKIATPADVLPKFAG